MREQFKTLGLLAGAALIGWLTYMGYVFVNTQKVLAEELTKVLNNQCQQLEQGVIDQAVQEALDGQKADQEESEEDSEPR